MRNRIKEICMASMFVLIIVGFGIAFLLSPDKEISTSERRKLSTFPDISLASIQNGEWFEKFEDYSLDQFPLRDNSDIVFTCRNIAFRFCYALIEIWFRYRPKDDR